MRLVGLLPHFVYSGMKDVFSAQDGSKVPFKVKTTTAFEKLFKAYCSRKVGVRLDPPLP